MSARSAGSRARQGCGSASPGNTGATTVLMPTSHSGNRYFPPIFLK